MYGSFLLVFDVASTPLCILFQPYVSKPGFVTWQIIVRASRTEMFQPYENKFFYTQKNLKSDLQIFKQQLRKLNRIRTHRTAIVQCECN